MEKIEQEIRTKLKYLLEDESLDCPETCSLSVAYVTDIDIDSWMEYGIGEEMLEYIDKHPDATLKELERHEYSLMGPLEISEEYDEDE